MSESSCSISGSNTHVEPLDLRSPTQSFAPVEGIGIVDPSRTGLVSAESTFDISGRRRAQPFDCPLDGRVCAQHGRELMGCKSPVGVPTWTRPESKDNHEPKARARPRGLVWRKPECKRCEATNRNRIHGRGMRGELAHVSKAHRYAAYGKCGACAPTVRVLTWGDLHRERCVDGDRPGRFNRDIKNQALRRAARRMR